MFFPQNISFLCSNYLSVAKSIDSETVNLKVNLFQSGSYSGKKSNNQMLRRLFFPSPVRKTTQGKL